MRLLRGEVSLPCIFSCRLNQKPACGRIDDIIASLVLGSWSEIASPLVGLAFFIMIQQADRRGVYGFP